MTWSWSSTWWTCRRCWWSWSSGWVAPATRRGRHDWTVRPSTKITTERTVGLRHPRRRQRRRLRETWTWTRRRRRWPRSRTDRRRRSSTAQRQAAAARAAPAAAVAAVLSNNAVVTTRNGLRLDCDSTAVRLPFDCSSTVLRPLDDLRHDRGPTCVCGLLHCGLNK